MRDLKDFSLSEWLRFLPLQYGFKQVRNDLMLERYKSSRPHNLDAFLQQAVGLAGRNIGLIVAFEQPWALDWLLRMANRNLADTTLLVFDNSLRDAARKEIQEVCRRNEILYLALPPNLTRHVNRSHGNAMTWIFHNVVRAITPRMFAFLDHDLIPVQSVDFGKKLGTQPVYGFRRPSKIDASWNLWAGYCCFDFASVAGLTMNFLYDFSRGLDTGGRNWDCLYRTIEHQQMVFAESRVMAVQDPVTGESHDVQIIDDSWLHIGGISYNNNFDLKAQSCMNLANTLDESTSWLQILGYTGV